VTNIVGETFCQRGDSVRAHREFRRCFEWPELVLIGGLSERSVLISVRAEIWQDDRRATALPLVHTLRLARSGAFL
jgi:hypothetical protein